jgi:hypothetical protein
MGASAVTCSARRVGAAGVALGSVVWIVASVLMILLFWQRADT